MIRLQRCTITIGCVLTGLLMGALADRYLCKPRVVAAATTPDGIELCVVQEFNWSPELFTTSFVYRKPSDKWLWFYYDHQDRYWGRARVELRAADRIAVFYRGVSPAITFRWDTETYSLHRMNRTLTGAQGRLPDNWSPGLPTRFMVSAQPDPAPAKPKSTVEAPQPLSRERGAPRRIASSETSTSRHGVAAPWWPDTKVILRDDIEDITARWKRRSEDARRRGVTDAHAFDPPKELRDFMALESLPAAEREVLGKLRGLSLAPWVRLGEGSDGALHVVAVDLRGNMNSISGPGRPDERNTDQAMAWLARLSELQAAFLCESGVTDAGLVGLLGLKNLRYVWLPPYATNEGLEQLASLSTIEHIRLHGCGRVTSDGFARWRAHPNLRTIESNMSDLRYVSHVLKSAPKFKGIDRGVPRAISLWSSDFIWRPDTEVIAAGDLADFGERQHEFVRQTGRENIGVRKALDDFQALAALPAAERAALDGLRALGAWPRVKLGRGAAGSMHVISVDVHGAADRFGYRDSPYGMKEPGDEMMTWIARLPRLQAIFLQNSGVTDAGLRALSVLRELRHIRVPWRMTDEGLAALAVLPTIEHLDLEGWAGNGTGFAAWRDHPRLASINLPAPGGASPSPVVGRLRAAIDLRPGLQIAMQGSLERTESWLPAVPWWPDTAVLTARDVEVFRLNLAPPLPPEMNPSYYLNLTQALADFAALEKLPPEERAALQELRAQDIWPQAKLGRDAGGALRVVAIGFRGAAYFRGKEERVTDAAMPLIARLPKLQAVFLQQTHASKAGVVALAEQLQELRYLWPSYFVGDAGLAALAKLPTIEHLNLRECGSITGEAFVDWRSHPTLSTVRLHPNPTESKRILALLKDAPRIRMIFDGQNLLEADKEEP